MTSTNGGSPSVTERNRGAMPAGPHDIARAAKIVATLGPASETGDTIEALCAAGADAFHLNFSHGSHSEHATRYGMVRAAAAAHGKPVSVLADLQGPKLRLGTFAEGRVQLQPGASLHLDLQSAPGTERRVQLPHPEVFASLGVGAHLLVDDGRTRLEVVACGADWADTRVLAGGALSDRKGVNVPDTLLEMAALVTKDEVDLAYALDLGVDWVARA